VIVSGSVAATAGPEPDRDAPLVVTLDRVRA
jgi:hypothetical protein